MRGMKTVWIFSLCLLLVAGALCLGGCGLLDNGNNLTITLTGDQDIFLEFGEEFTEPGATAKFWTDDGSVEPFYVDVVVKGNVDTSTIGTYELTYTARHKGASDKEIRRVHVTDSVFPEIILAGDPSMLTPFGETYQEEGFTAKDNYDGDITARVIRHETADLVTYTVTDTAGNMTTVTRQIRYGDSIPPEMILKGEQHVVIKAGESYIDPGCTAKDNMDGNLTSGIIPEGTIDFYMPGTYELTYTVTDASGNEGMIVRTVEVQPQPAQTDLSAKNKVVYLTFDDGPGKRTPELLEILKKYNVKATFFVVNTGYASTIEKIGKDGHALAIHSATHDFKKIYASESNYYADLNKMAGIIKQYSGQDTKLIRFPGGGSNTISRFNPGIMTTLSKSVKANGYRYFDWNVDSKDAGGAKTAEEVFNNVTTGIAKNDFSVVLQHDIKGFSIDAVERIINWGLANGYTFKPLDTNSPVCEHRVNN